MPSAGTGRGMYTLVMRNSVLSIAMMMVSSSRVYNDIVTTIGRGNGAMLILLAVSAAFDTIDHDNLFCILEKYVGICGNALKLIKSYFSNHTQCVQMV